MLGRLTFLVGLWILVGCTRPAIPPALPEKGSSPIERIALTDRLSSKDIRDIFKALNRTGSLDGLNPFIEEVSENDLEEFVRILSRYLYEESDFLKHLGLRIQNKAFTYGQASLSQWQNESGFRDEILFLYSVLRSPHLPESMDRLRVLIDPSFTKTLEDARKKLEDVPPILRYPTQDWIDDIQTFLKSENGIRKATALVGSLKEFHFFPSFIRAVRHIPIQYGGTAFTDLEETLRQLLLSPSAMPPATHLVEQLVLGLDVLNSPPNGLFRVVAEKLHKSPEILNMLEETIAPWIENVISDVVREQIVIGRSSQNFPHRFLTVVKAIESITGSRRPASASDQFLYNLPIYTGAFVLTSWISQVMEVNATSPLHWESPVQTRPFHLDFRDQSVRKNLENLGLADFSRNLAVIVNGNGFGNFDYRWDFSANNLSFKEVIRQAIIEIHRVRPLTDPTSFFRALLLHLGQSEASILSFSEWDKIPNLFETFNQFLSIQTAESLQRLSKFFFGQLRLGNLTPRSKQTFLSFYEGNPNLKKKAEIILSLLPLIQKTTEMPSGGVAAIHTYHVLTQAIAPRDMRSLSEIVNFLAKSKLLAAPRGGVPHFRPVYEFLISEKTLSRYADWIVAIPDHKTEDFSRGLQAFLEPLHFEESLSLMGNAIEQSPLGAGHWLDRWRKKKESVFTWLDAWDPDERAWLAQFITRQDFTKLWSFFYRNGNPQKALQAIHELRKLSERGTIQEALTLLANIRNERMKKVALTFLEWDRTGEFRQFLSVLQVLLGAVRR